MAAHFVNVVYEGKHGPRVPIDHKRAVELVRSHRRLLYGHGRVWLAEGGRLIHAAQVFSLVEVVERRDLAGRSGEAGDGRQDAGEEQLYEPHFRSRCRVRKMVEQSDGHSTS